jgi:hypothetical protein
MTDERMLQAHFLHATCGAYGPVDTGVGCVSDRLCNQVYYGHCEGSYLTSPGISCSL